MERCSTPRRGLKAPDPILFHQLSCGVTLNARCLVVIVVGQVLAQARQQFDEVAGSEPAVELG